ncbi:MAG: hypothetical protein ACPH4H_07335, partial [Candidatus Poseidoniaceae archaeon]
GDGDKLDLSGYGYADVECKKEGELKGIPVDICSAEMKPLDRPIQAKLINSGELIDAIPGALPVFFESKVEIKVEQISGAIIAGQSQSIFWLDTRNTTEQQNPPQESDLQEVFMIKTSGELDDETAETMESQIVTNQEMFGFFTNFDHWVDFVALSLWVIGLGTLGFGVVLLVKGRDKTENQGRWGQEPDAAPMTDQTDLVEEDSKEADNDATSSIDEDESSDSNQDGEN